MKKKIEQQRRALRSRWVLWQGESDREKIIQGPWSGWRRSYILLASAFLLLALAPWLWSPPEPPVLSPGDIQSQGRIGEALLPGSTLFLDPGDPSPGVDRVLGQKIFLRGLQPPRLDFAREPLQGELARFEDQVWQSEEINDLARAELRLRGLSPRRLDRQMQELVLQREIESAWLLREAELQGIQMPDAASLLRQEDLLALQEAGLGFAQAEKRLLVLLLAAEIRNLQRARGGDLRALEAEWFQRWSPRTSCRVLLPICSVS